MATQPNLRVRISADLADIKQGLGVLRGELAKVKQDAAQSIDLRGMNAGLTSLRNTLAGVFAGVSVGSVFRSVIRETRDASDEVAQLRAVLKSTGEQAGFTAEQLVAMADKLAGSTTHSAGEITKAQTRLLSYTGIVGEQFPKALQMAIDQSARLGENIEQSAETIGKALDKPSQGVAALTKQGFKFTEAEKERMKVLEKAGRLGEAQAIVLDSMAESYAGAAAAARNTFGGALTAVGNSRRALKVGSGSGGLWAATRALNELAEALRSPDVREGFNQLATAVLNAVTGFARFMAQDGVKYLRLLADVAALVVKNIDVLAVALGTYLAAQGIAAAIVGVSSLIKQLTALRAALVATTITANGLRASLALMGGPITLAIAALSAGLYYLYQRTSQATEAARAHTEALEANKDMAKVSREEALKEAKAKREQALQTLNAARAVLEERRARMIDATGRTARGGDRGDGAALAAATNVERARASVSEAEKVFDDWGRRLVELSMQVTEEVLDGAGSAAEGAGAEVGKALARSNALMRDSVARALAELDRLYKGHEISAAEYFQARRKLSEQAIDLEIEQARNELAVTKDLGARRKLEEQIVILQRDRAELGVKAARDQKDAEEDLAKALGEVKTQLLELDGNTARAERVRLETEYKELFERLRAASDETGAAMVDNLITRLVAKAQADELKDAAGRIGATLQGIESSVSSQSAAGLLGGVESERRLSEARAAALAQYRELRDKAIAYLQSLDPSSPEAANARLLLQQLNGDILNIQLSQNQLRQQVADASVDASLNFFTNLREGAMTASQLLRQLGIDFATMIYDMQAKAVAAKIGQKVASFFGTGGDESDIAAGAVALQSAAATTGVAGGVIKGAATALGVSAAALMEAARALAVANAVGGGMNVGVAHTGAMVGQWKVRRRVSPLLFGNAPRYHTGSPRLGLRAGEHPAILEDGERVLSKRQNMVYEALMAGGGTGAGPVTTPIVAIGDDAVANALASTAGERVVMTHVRNNWEGLQRGG